MQPEKRLLRIHEIPEELITKILLRLLVKFLMRFKLVSKSFNAFITDVHFVKLHLRRCSASNANPLVIFYPPHVRDADISSLHVKSLLKTPPTTIMNEVQSLCSNWKEMYLPIGSCNGLVCLIGIHYDDDFDEQLFWVRLWNPATRSTSQKWFKLTIMPEHVDSYLYVCCGFGYDHISDTYKVLFLDRNQDVLLFNMGDTNWRHVGCFPLDLTTLKGSSIIGVHLSGTLNWLSILKIYENYFNPKLNKYNIGWDNGSCMILSFDLNKEEFVRLLLPAMSHKFNDPHLGILGECLCVSHEDQRDNFVIWQMKKFGDNGSWTKLLCINYYSDLLRHGLSLPSCFPLYMFDNGDLLILPEMFLYNLRDNRVHPLELPEEMYLSCGGICCESLISPY